MGDESCVHRWVIVMPEFPNSGRIALDRLQLVAIEGVAHLLPRNGDGTLAVNADEGRISITAGYEIRKSLSTLLGSVAEKLLCPPPLCVVVRAKSIKGRGITLGYLAWTWLDNRRARVGRWKYSAWLIACVGFQSRRAYSQRMASHRRYSHSCPKSSYVPVLRNA